jgi:diguanylate cyclase (GGDEF)-like protein
VNSYKCSVLVVDDDSAIRDVLQRLLETEFEVLSAGSAESARSLLEKVPVDIILADLRLPGGSGIELLERAFLTLPGTIRILMTGFADQLDLIEAVNRARVHHFVTKPWNAEQLLATLRDSARRIEIDRAHAHLNDELRQLTLDLEQRVQERTGELEEALRQLQQRNSMLRRMALTDDLTGLPNRRAIKRLGRKEIARHARYPSPLAFGLVDADRFKDINTRYLHDGGDHVLAWLAQTLANAVRTVDTVGKFGGDEFMIVAPETDQEGATILGERVRQTVECGTTEYRGQELRITVSVGMAVAPAGGTVGFDQLRHAAAAALNEAKTQGRNRCVVRVLPPSQEPPAVAMLVG